MDTKHLNLNRCIWCEESDTANLCQGVVCLDDQEGINGYFLECNDCDATTKSFDNDREAAAAWNAGQVWGYDV